MTQYSPGGLNLLTPLRIAFDDSGTTDVLFEVNAAGELTITPAGGKSTVVGTLVRAAFASYYWSAQGQAAVAVATTPVKVSTALSTTAGEAQNFTVSTNNRATYVGTVTQKFRVTYTVTCTSESNNITMGFVIAKNGVPITGTEVRRDMGTADDGATSLQWIVELEENDYIELWGVNQTDTGDVFVEFGQCTINEA